MNKYETSQYEYSAVSIEEVVANPDEYIIPELQSAAKVLWDKNIFTHMTSNYQEVENGEKHFIAIDGVFRGNNCKIFKELSEQYPQHYYFCKGGHSAEYHNAIGFDSTKDPAENEKRMLKLVSFFEMQDVSDSLSMSLQQFQEKNPDVDWQDLYVPETDRVFKNEFYKNAHLKYLAHLKDSPGSKPSELQPEEPEF